VIVVDLLSSGYRRTAERVARHLGAGRRLQILETAMTLRPRSGDMSADIARRGIGGSRILHDVSRVAVQTSASVLAAHSSCGLLNQSHTEIDKLPLSRF
jgi:hypothetical protein